MSTRMFTFHLLSYCHRITHCTSFYVNMIQFWRWQHQCLLLLDLILIVGAQHLFKFSTQFRYTHFWHYKNTSKYSPEKEESIFSKDFFVDMTTSSEIVCLFCMQFGRDRTYTEFVLRAFNAYRCRDAHILYCLYELWVFVCSHDHR